MTAGGNNSAGARFRAALAAEKPLQLVGTINAYAAKHGIALKQTYDAENVSRGMSLVVSTGSVTLLPLYVKNMLIPSVVARPLQGEPPTIDLMLGFSKSNTSPLLKRFVARADELVANVRRQNSVESKRTR